MLGIQLVDEMTSAGSGEHFFISHIRQTEQKILILFAKELKEI